MSMRCIVLAGGFGTRLRGVLGDVPKCLAPIGSRAFLDYQLDQLLGQGVDEVILSLGHLAQQVVDWLRRERPQAPVRWVVEPRALGTGGAVAFAMDQLEIEEALVANGDTFLSSHLGTMATPLALAEGERCRMAVMHADNRARFGGIVLGGDRVSRFVPKGCAGPGLINAGLYRLHRSALPPGPSTPTSLEDDVLPLLAGAGQIRAARLAGEFVDIGVPQDYSRFVALNGAGLATSVPH